MAKSQLEIKKTGFLQQLQEETSGGCPRSQRGEMDTYSDSLLPIAFIVTDSLVLHSGTIPFISWPWSSRKRMILFLLLIYIFKVLGKSAFFVKSSSQVRSIWFQFFLLYLSDTSGFSEAWSEVYISVSTVFHTLIQCHLIRMEILSGKEPNTYLTNQSPQYLKEKFQVLFCWVTI